MTYSQTHYSTIGSTKQPKLMKPDDVYIIYSEWSVNE